MKPLSLALVVAFVFFLAPAFAAFCVDCGQELPDTAKFCSSCGQAIGAKIAATDTVVLRIALLPDPRYPDQIVKMFRLTTEMSAQVEDKSGALTETSINGTRCFEIEVGRELLGKSFTVSFAADRRKIRSGNLEKWSNKKIILSGVLEEHDAGTAPYILAAMAEDEPFASRVEFHLLSARQTIELAKKEESEQREAARVAEVTARYLDQKAETRRKAIENRRQRDEQDTREKQLRATKETNRQLQQLNSKIGY